MNVVLVSKNKILNYALIRRKSRTLVSDHLYVSFLFVLPNVLKLIYVIILLYEIYELDMLKRI